MKIIIKKAAAVILLLALTVSVLASCTVERSFPGAPKGMRPCNDGSQGVIVYVPANWGVDTSTGIPTAYFTKTESTMLTLVTVPAAEWQGGKADKTVPQYWEEQKVKFASMKDFSVIRASEEAKDDLYFTDVIAENRQLFEYRYTFKMPQQTSELTYKFAQAFFVDPASNALHIVTYSSLEPYFDSHLEELSEIYKNLKFVSAPEQMQDTVPPAQFVQIENTPEGYSALTGEHIDYVLFVPSDWIPLLNTGITAASAPSAPSVTCNVTAFNLENNDNVIDAADFDSYFAAFEKTLTDSVGAPVFADPEVKYSAATLGVLNSSAVLDARRYSYTITFDGVEYAYTQYISIFQGYVYQLTFCCKSADLPTYSAVFDGIASNFKFKA